jgi:hypothetical protein
MELSIEGGSVLIVTIDNVGSTPIYDITWNVTIEGGLIIRPRFIPGTITEILPGDSYSLNNPIIGIGLGKLFPIPRITFTVDTPEIEPVATSADAQIFFTTVVIL